MSEAIMYVPRRFGHRKHEMATQRVVTEICKKLDLEWETIPKLFVCKRCRHPLLAISHALALNTDTRMLQELLSMRIIFLSRRLRFKYIAAIVMPPYVMYFVIGGDRANIVLANEFYKRHMIYLMGRKCPSCGTEISHRIRKLYNEVKNRILVKEEIDALQYHEKEIIVDAITSENFFREIGSDDYSACDIDFVLFRGITPLAVIEAVNWKHDYDFKPTSVSRKFAEMIGVPFVLLKIIANGRLTIEVDGEKFEGNVETVADYLRRMLFEKNSRQNERGKEAN